MQTLTLSQLQKKISIVSKTRVPIRIINGRKKTLIAHIHPVGGKIKNNIADKLAGSMSKNNDLVTDLSWDEIREKGWGGHVKDKKW